MQLTHTQHHKAFEQERILGDLQQGFSNASYALELYVQMKYYKNEFIILVE